MALLLLLGLSWRPPFPVTPISNGYHSTAGGVVGPGDRNHHRTPLQSPISQTMQGSGVLLALASFAALQRKAPRLLPTCTDTSPSTHHDPDSVCH